MCVCVCVCVCVSMCVCTQSAMTQWVCGALRVKSLSPAALSLRQLIERESSAHQPVLLLTTPGADPSAELSDYASHAVGKDRFHEIAMGQGQVGSLLSTQDYMHVFGLVWWYVLHIDMHGSMGQGQVGAMGCALTHPIALSQPSSRTYTRSNKQC